jgi:multidrug efflux system outer membrane protein
MDLLLEPTSLLWTLGPRLSLPLFSGHKNRFNLSRSKSMHEEALAGYRQAFLAAVADVETSLSQIQNYALQASAQQRARASAERAAQLARTRYEAGTSPYLDVIEANRTVLTVQRATIQTSEQRLAATVNLIKAIGGGWDVSQAMMFPGLQSDPAVRSNDRNASPGVFAKVRRWFQTKS